MDVIKGKVFVLGDNVDTDQILPGYAMSEPFAQLGKFAMAGFPGLDFVNQVRPGDIIVGGRNFGCGSSREQAPIALKMSGVSLVIASSFSRIFRRNAINIGLPVFIADLAGLLKDGDMIEADLPKGVIRYPGGAINAAPLSGNPLKTLEYGGLIPRVKAGLAARKLKET